MDVYKSLTKTLALLLVWVAGGWALFPTLVIRLSEMVDEPVSVGRVEPLGYTLSCVSIILSIFFIWRARKSKL